VTPLPPPSGPRFDRPTASGMLVLFTALFVIEHLIWRTF
jgi:hypothetical protein